MHSTHNCVIQTLISTTVSESAVCRSPVSADAAFLETAGKRALQIGCKTEAHQDASWLPQAKPPRNPALLCTQNQGIQPICLDSKWSGIASHPHLPPAQKCATSREATSHTKIKQRHLATNTQHIISPLHPSQIISLPSPCPVSPTRPLALPLP